MKNRINYIYISYNDRITSGIIKTQVLSKIKEKNYAKKNLILIWQPHIYFREKRELMKVKKELITYDVNLHILPLAVPSKYLERSRFFILTLKIYGMFLFLFKEKFLYSDLETVISARGYHSGLIAAFIKGKLKNFHFIFDPRSLYPEESCTVNKWFLGSNAYKSWKKAEKFILDKSDELYVVGEEMKNWFILSGYKKKIFFDRFKISNNLKNHNFKNIVSRNNLRGNLSLSNGDIVFGFCGSIGLSNQWNSIYPYINHLNNIYPFLKKNNVNSYFAIKSDWLTNNLKNELNKYLLMPILYLENYSVPDALEIFDIGCHFMLQGPDNFTRVGIKVYEYLYAGLHVLTNSSAGGAKNIAHKYNALINLDELYLLENHFLELLISSKDIKKRLKISSSFQEFINKKFK